MPPSNLSSLTPDTFILVGIPGMEQLQVWISIPFCCVYVAALLGSGVLLLSIWTARSLHQPMYLFLAMLALADLTLSTTVVPKMLALFMFQAREISFGACLTQMFFLHFTTTAESKILLAMAFGRFVAICFPLRYGAVLTLSAVAKTGLAALLRAFCAIFPCIFLLRWLPFCGHHVIPHTYCEHVGIARLACADVSANIWRCPGSRPAPALHTCGSHVCVLLLFYVPIIFAALTQRFGRSIPPELHILLANLYMLFPPLLNPVVYGMRTQQIRDRVLKVFVRP